MQDQKIRDQIHFVSRVGNHKNILSMLPNDIASRKVLPHTSVHFLFWHTNGRLAPVKCISDICYEKNDVDILRTLP